MDKRYNLTLDESILKDLHSASYYSGKSKKEIITDAIRGETGRLLVQCRTRGEVEYTKECGLSDKPATKKKVLVKRKVN